MQLQWTAPVSKMNDQHLPKIVLDGELSTGHPDSEAP